MPDEIPDVDKRRKADFVIETDKGLEHAFAAVKESSRNCARAARS
jgi:hypothetical protein